MATAVRPVWKGALKLSLISIPIRVFPATNAASDVSFRQIHRKCHTPIKMKKWCPHCDEEVGPDDIVKGYESSKGRFLLVEEEDIKAVRPESTRVVDLSHLMDHDDIDPVLIERSYYVTPDNKAAGSPFAVIRDALAGKSAIGRLAIHGREYLVAIVQREKALMLHTLRTSGEVRAVDAIDGLELADVKVKPDEVKLARQVLGSLPATSDLTDFTDHYQEALRAMLEKKGEVELIDEEDAPATSKKVVNLMDALRQSLERVSKEKKRPARATHGRRVAPIAGHHATKRRRAS